MADGGEVLPARRRSGGAPSRRAGEEPSGEREVLEAQAVGVEQPSRGDVSLYSRCLNRWTDERIVSPLLTLFLRGLPEWAVVLDL
jgi:hypothetical protein